jgi:hypothetical protein
MCILKKKSYEKLENNELKEEIPSIHGRTDSMTSIA